MINSKLIVAFALLCAVAIPVYAGAAVDSKNQDVTITVNKGLEMVTPGGDQALTAVTPTGTGNTTSTATSGSVSLRSNASWNATLSSSTTTVTMAGVSPTTGSLATAPEVSGTDGSYLPLASSAAPATIKSAQTKNTNNTALSYSYFVRQPISWGDGSGNYKVTVSHGANN